MLPQRIICPSESLIGGWSDVVNPLSVNKTENDAISVMEDHCKQVATTIKVEL